MKYLILCAFFVSSILANSFWKIDEFLNHNPQEQIKMKQFDQIVQNDAVALQQSSKKVKIPMLYPENQLSDYWTRSQKSFEARLKELNIQYDIKPIFADENDIKKLQERLKEFLANESDYLIFTLNIDGHKKLNGIAMAEAIQLDLLYKEAPTIDSGKFEVVDETLDSSKIELSKQKAFRYSK